MKQTDKFTTSTNPAGFIEQHYIGVQTPESVQAAVDELIRRAKKLKAQDQPIFVLVDVTQVPKIDMSGRMAEVRKNAVKAMRTVDYDRIAVYGDVTVQLLVNTMVLIAGKRKKIRVFADRVQALKWLKSGK